MSNLHHNFNDPNANILSVNSRGSWATFRQATDEYLQKYGSWIEEKLGVPRTEWSFVDSGHDSKINKSFKAAVSRTMLNSDASEAKAVFEAIESCEVHPQYRESVFIYPQRKARIVSSMEVHAHSGECCAQIKFKTITVVYVSFLHVAAPMSDDATLCEVTIVAKGDRDRYMDFLVKTLEKVPLDRSIFSTWDGGLFRDVVVSDRSWESLVVDDSVIRLVKKDAEAFFQRKEWFKRNQLPWSRGWLFHGPPGNGKTSTIKAIMAHHRLNAHTLALYSDKASDAALENVFRLAASSAPCMVVLEDLDRAFPKGTERRTKVSLQCLLNCLDGLGTKEGVITIATANEPTALDKAILKRPGRFDRAVFFGNPTKELRLRYLLLKSPALPTELLTNVLAESEGFSYAQMQEVYILAGQSAFERGSEMVDVADLEAGVVTLRNATNHTNNKDGVLGFGSKGHLND